MGHVLCEQIKSQRLARDQKQTTDHGCDRITKPSFKVHTSLHIAKMFSIFINLFQRRQSIQRGIRNLSSLSSNQFKIQQRMMLPKHHQRLNSHSGGGQQDQKGTSPHNDEYEQDRASASQCLEESMQLRGDEPVSELYIWGNDYYGQLGVGSDKVIHNLPKVCSFNIVVTDVSCGEEHTVFVQGDGGYVYAMGSNSEGRLGTGNTDIRSCNVPTLVDGLQNIKKVSCGQSHSLALSEDGKAYAWGQAFYGALGIAPNDRGALENATRPQLLPSEAFGNEPIRDLQAGGRHSMFVTERSKVFGCGDANQGQLGLGDSSRDRVLEPTQIMGALQGMQIVQVACGKYHTLFLLDNMRSGETGGTRRELWACGANNCGQIGNNSNQNMFEPVPVDPRVLDDGKQSNHAQRSHHFASISAWNASAAVTEEGIMYVWGSGIFGEFKRPRKVKLQNNIKVNRVIVGGSFIVIVDQDNRIVVWGSNSNGEIGVGDSKIRSHPTRLETIEEKTVSAVSVGGSFAFAIGKTTNRMENSIFADEANRSQLSGIQKQGMSNIMEKEPERNNHSVNSLEEQLQQIALHSASKKNKRQGSDQKQQQTRPISQDRSFGGLSGPANPGVDGTTRFEQVAGRSNKQDDQVVYLRQVVEEKEKKISDLQESQHKKHAEYQEKLQRFKEMQDKEMAMTEKVREDNTKLREENQSLHDQNDSLKRELRASVEQNRRNDSMSTFAQPPVHKPHQTENLSLHQQHSQQNQTQSQSYKPLGPDPASDIRSQSNRPSTTFHPSSTLQCAPTSLQHATYALNTPPQTSYTSAPNQMQLGQQLYSQPERSFPQVQPPVSASTHYQYEGQHQQQLPSRDERFIKSAYQRADEQLLMAGGRTVQPEDQLRAEPTGSEHGNYARYKDSEPAGGLRSSSDGPVESRKADLDKLEMMYKQRYSVDAYPGHIQLQGKHERISIEGETLNASRQQEPSANKEFQRAYTAENPSTGGFMRQVMMQKEASEAIDKAVVAHHQRHVSQNELPKSFSRRDGTEQTSQPRLNGPVASYPQIVNTGRAENLRSLGNELVRASSRDGASVGASTTNAPVLLHHKLENLQPGQESMARHTSFGLYQPSTKYAHRNSEQRRNEEDEHQSYNKFNPRYEANPSVDCPSTEQQYNRQLSQQLERSPDRLRSLTPNAENSSSAQNDMLQNRVAYKPMYERYSVQQEPGYVPAGLQHRRDEELAATHQVKQDYGNIETTSAVFKERPGSAHHREPSYLTENGKQMTMSLKYDKLSASGTTNNEFTRGGERDMPNSQVGRTDINPNEFRSSPGKPPRQDYSSGYTMKSQFNPEASGTAKPPTYKPLDYQSRYSHEPQPGSNNGAYDDQATATDDASASGKYTSTFNRASAEYPPASSNVRNSIDEPMPKDNKNQQISGFSNSHSYSGGQNYQAPHYDIHDSREQQQQPVKRDQPSTNDQLLPDRGSYSTFGGHQTMNFSQKSRPPFAVQQLNDQMPSPSQSYSQTEAGYQTKLIGQASSYPQHNVAATSYTPQGSGRRSGSLTEIRSNGGGDTGKEDIKSKLARYKKEREDFEQVRQQFRQKSTDISNSMAKPGQQTNTNKVMSENTPVNRSHSGTHQFAGLGTGDFKDLAKGNDFNGSAAGIKGPNIFAVENSGGSGQAKAFTTPGHMTSGSPAFGLPEQSQSRDH